AVGRCGFNFANCSSVSQNWSRFIALLQSETVNHVTPLDETPLWVRTLIRDPTYARAASGRSSCRRGFNATPAPTPPKSESGLEYIINRRSKSDLARTAARSATAGHVSGYEPDRHAARNHAIRGWVSGAVGSG